MIDKIDYVKKAQLVRAHSCHWPGCNRQVPPAMWGCKTHWFKIPKGLRDRIWATYRPGQEEDRRPSEAYIKVAQAVQDWIRENHEQGI